MHRRPRVLTGPAGIPRRALLALGALLPWAAGAQDVGSDALLARRPLQLPWPGLRPADLTDTFTQSRAAGRVHEAIDIPAPRGTPVHAVDDGRIARLFTSVPGGLTIYQFDPDGNFAYYYAHLDTYALGLAAGQAVVRGQRLGTVGSSGNALPSAPHLHFAIFRMGPERQWWRGQAINPYPHLMRARAWR